jgi:hypothetical protein
MSKNTNAFTRGRTASEKASCYSMRSPETAGEQRNSIVTPEP